MVIVVVNMAGEVTFGDGGGGEGRVKMVMGEWKCGSGVVVRVKG